jgi:hypothetical protein
MQAAGVTPPILNLKSLSAGKAQGFPNQDRFQSLLQERILSRGCSSSSLNRSSLKSQLHLARSVSSTSKSPSAVLNDFSKWSTLRSSTTQGTKNGETGLQTDGKSIAFQLICKNSKNNPAVAAAVIQPTTEMPEALKCLMEFLNQQPGQALKVSQDQIQELKDYLQQAGLPAAQVERLLNSDNFQTKGLTAQDVQAAWQEVCQNSSQQALVAQLSQATASQLANTSVNLEMPATLKALTDFIKQQPGQTLKVPPDRLPQMQDFLLKAGIPPEQVENLLNSPQVQEQGLTAADVQAAWQKGIQNSLQQAFANSSSPLNSVQKLTSQADYQSLWQNLTLPPQALGDLRQELQKLGVPAESLTGLNQQNFPDGISLTQVWELIQQSDKASSAAAANGAANASDVLDSTPLLEGGKDLAKWRQLLTQAGMDPELAQTLTSGSGFTPTTRGELRATLVQMAPSSTTQEQDIPKPLYLPTNVRVRQVPLLQQNSAGQGQGQGNGFANGNANGNANANGSGNGNGNGNGNANLSQSLGFPTQAQTANLAGTTNLNNFLALVSNNGALPGDQAGATGATGEQVSTSVNSYLTPEVREALWAQVQSGVLGNLRPGENQITLTLDPPDLGKLNLTLNLKGETVEVTAITSHSAVADAATAGVQQLAQALNQQGLILTQFQFHHQDESQGQYNLNFSQNPGDQKQTGQQDPDKWERPPTPQRQWAGGFARGIDCFA